MNKATHKPSVAFRLFQRVLRRFFRTLYLLEVTGLEHMPVHGPVVVAANHVNPFDAIIIGVCLPRRIRFVVWNRTFNKPALRWILNACACIPINRDRPDTVAFKQCLGWLQAGNVLGIFPEGRYTETGHLHDLKPGTMRIALAARAVVVPATLTGAYRAWPLRGANAKPFPRPWKISLKFHQPIHNLDGEAPAEPQSSIATQRKAAVELTDKLATAINSTLEPAIRAEAKVEKLTHQPAPPLRLYEWFLPIVLLAARHLWTTAIAAVYFAYLLADIYLIPQSARTRSLRNFAPIIALLAAYPVLLTIIGLPPAGPWLLFYGVVALYAIWATITYCFTKYLQFQRLVRGLLVTLYLSILALILWPALPRPILATTVALFALAFDFAHNRRRFWPAAGVLAGTLIAAIVLRGYPLTALWFSPPVAALVFAYMHLFKFRAHDGRRI